MHHLKKRQVAGLPLTVTAPADVAKLICETASQRQHGGQDIHLINAYSVALTESDSFYRRCLEEASHNLPDGRPLAWVTKLSSAPLNQVRGPALFEKVIDLGRQHGVRHFLLGSTPETLDLLEAALKHRYPGVKVVGKYSPPFRSLSARDIEYQDTQILNADADIVWVGLGTPKQDLEARRLARDKGLYAIAVGAAFDFSAGTKKEAPRWVGNLGLEWLFRFASEPRRLWRRYLIGNLVFIRAVAKGATQK
ncbi:WecB/TagA/CpsF family glycosyltransferase [Arthrobacter sp. S13_S34]|nr:WecB/TagA/CpsF family glycosyltransferase [Arthrobacter sp. S13_S34]